MSNKKIKWIWCPKELRYKEDTSVKELDNTLEGLKTMFGMNDN